MAESNITHAVIGAAIEVHRYLGPGLLESAYEAALCRELEYRLIPYERQKPIALCYKGITLEAGFRLDLLVAQQVIVEVKAVETLERVHIAQLLTYLKLTDCKIGLLMNFNVPILRDGIKRVVR